VPLDPLWIEATFKCEDFDAASGEEIGPLILWDLDANTFYKEFDWMPKSDAKELAAEMAGASARTAEFPPTGAQTSAAGSPNVCQRSMSASTVTPRYALSSYGSPR
jgi:hypothetical protein